MNRYDRLWIALIWIVAVGWGAALGYDTDADPRSKVTVALVLAAVDGALATGLYVAARRNLHDRRDVLWMTGIWVPLLGVIAIVLVAAGPEHSYNAGFVVGVIGCLLTGWHLDRRRRERKARMKALRKLRPCPKCGEDMLREADTCPECHARSTPWIQQGDLWLTPDENGTWQRWNEAGERFEPYRNASALTDGPVGGQRSAGHDAKLWR